RLRCTTRSSFAVGAERSCSRATTRHAPPIARTWCGVPLTRCGAPTGDRASRMASPATWRSGFRCRRGPGGGSSDAAAALRALGRLWRVAPARQRLIAPALGADVPYFFEGGTVLGLERGDLLFRLADRAPASIVLAIPAVGVSTKNAFAWL